MVALRLCVLLAALGGCDLALGLEHRPGGGDRDDEDVDRDAGIVADSPSALACPSNYVSHGASSYRVVDSLVGWETAASHCRIDGDQGRYHTHLAVWGDDSERLAIAPTISGAYWIGLSDLRTPPVLRWNTGETGNVTGSVAWTLGQPAGTGCTTTRADDHWELTSCEEPRGYLCECDARPDDPSQYQ